MARCSATEVLKRYWGYDRFLPLQQEVIENALSGRDSLAVMPTGGGKSLCYQIPAVLRDGLTVVVSPLISLMKDQVDALRSCGIGAAAWNSSLATREQEQLLGDVAAGRLRLLYVAPERLMAESTRCLLKSQRPAGFAVDEAHCISSWGHDFRPEYRALRTLREQFADTVWQAMTATATERVRADIIAQLGLRNPHVLVGDFFRPNLAYHVQRRRPGWNQIYEVMERHREKAGIIYAIARTKVEELSDILNRLGFRTLPYHAGLTNLQRQRHQEALIHDEIDAIVATVAFGMGIDKPNVRYVIHAEMPRSIESYVQESGRAGRDAMPAECWLFHAAADYQTWLRMIEESGKENREQALRSLHDMHEYCHGVTCRHRYLVEYFGQTLDAPCGACDICLGRVTVVDDPLRVSQMILSCVLRCEEKFGADYISRVLTGSRALKIIRFSHHKLSTWGLLKGTDRIQVRDWIDQLRAQKLLTQEGQHPVLKVTNVGRKVLRGEVTPNLMKTVRQSINVTSTRILDSWEGVDRALFERLRQLRQTLATEADVASFVVFSDATLRDLARRRPTTLECLLAVHGMGQHKATRYGDRLMTLIRLWCRENGVCGDVFWPEDSGQRGERDARPSAGARASFELFDRAWSVDQVADHMGRAHSTVYGYLEHYIAARGITDPTRWVDARTAQRVEVAACYNDTGRLKPLYEALHQQVTYEQIRVVLACLGNRSRSDA